MVAFHPELRGVARLIPRFTFTPGLARFVRFLQRVHGVRKPPVVAGMIIRDIMIPCPPANPALRIRLFNPDNVVAPKPAMIWIHGGGFLAGTPEQDQANNIAMCRELGMTVVAVDYRLGPGHSYPAALDDCYAALTWLQTEAGELGVDPTRIAIGGSSAGGGLAAGLVLLAHDRGEVPVAFQLLFYPMLDDRTTLRRNIDQNRFRLWNSRSNLLGWTEYLGRSPGGDAVADYAAAARREHVQGLPPAWIGVGTCDLFYDEDVAYARRLGEAGVACTLNVVEGAFHGFDMVVPNAQVVRDFRESCMAAMRQSLSIPDHANDPPKSAIYPLQCGTE